MKFSIALALWMFAQHTTAMDTKVLVEMMTHKGGVTIVEESKIAELSAQKSLRIFDTATPEMVVAEGDVGKANVVFKLTKESDLEVQGNNGSDNLVLKLKLQEPTLYTVNSHLSLRLTRMSIRGDELELAETPKGVTCPISIPSTKPIWPRER